MILEIVGDRAGGGDDGRVAANVFHNMVITPYKGKLEAWYLSHRSVWLYFKIIFLTAWCVVNSNCKAYHLFKGLPEVPNDLKEFLL